MFNGRHRAGEHGTIDDVYCGGVAVTYGSPRQHIWTFAAGIWEITLQLTFTARESRGAGYSPPFHLAGLLL